jgi:WASH complex subunit 7
MALSQFLYDEYIYAPLFAERKFFQENRDKLNSKYPFERAEQLAMTIKSLGEIEENVTFLEKFKTLITQIGNALGFVEGYVVNLVGL